MKTYTDAIDALIGRLALLPGAGRKSAARMAFHILSLPPGEAETLASAILRARETTRFCGRCQNFTDAELCPLCRDETRDKSVICVVSEPRDVSAVERSRGYKGLYHVLHGALSPLNKIGPEDLRIRELLARLGGAEEVILATNHDAEGDATALYLAGLIRPLGVKVTRPAYGIPMGGALQFADELTLNHALAGRREFT